MVVMGESSQGASSVDGRGLNDGHNHASPTTTSPLNSPLSLARTAAADDNDLANEHSPLLSPTSIRSSSRDGDEDPLVDDRTVLDDDDDHWQQTKSVWYLILATISIGGLQIAWSVELSNGSPYLLSLGLTKSLMAVVWIAGPLSGSLVQPYIGILSDNCRIRWGKRKPFMIVGAAATIVSFMGLSWAREMVAGILGLFGVESDSEAVKTSTIVVAVFFVYVLDFSINTVQAAIRAFMVDTVPTHQQESANSWASRITGFGNIVGYIAGYIDLPKYMGFFGNTQFKVLCAIASIALGVTVAISCLLVPERDPRSEGEPQKQGGVITFFKSVFRSISKLPPQTRKVCETQFCVWIAWFPVLFYVSSWIAEMYVQPFLEENPNLSEAEVNVLYEKGTRIGTFGLLIYAITSLSANVILPFFVAPSSSSLANQSSHTLLEPESKESSRLDRFLDKLIIPWLTLRRTWVASLILFAVALFSTYFVRSTTGACVVLGVIGIPWAMALWAPFAIISAEISKRDALRRSRKSARVIADDEEELTDDQAGVLLGIHNMSIAAPQIIATLGSSAIFKAMQKPRGTPGDHSLAAVLTISGIFALLAAGIATRIAEDVPLPGKGAKAVRDEVEERLLRGQGYESVERA